MIAPHQQPSPSGNLTILKRSIEPQILAARRGELLPDEEHGHYWRDRAKLRYEEKVWDETPWQQKLLAFLRDHVNEDIPRRYYTALIGHDIHMSVLGELYITHYHHEQKDPFTGEWGWTENLGRVSCGKVTAAFRDFLSLNMVTDDTKLGDFKWHEVGTDATAESNAQTALIVSTGIARVSGTQTNPTAPTYQSIATVTADASETWQEHALWNIVTAGTMFDRSLISPTVAVVNLDTCSFTYVATFAAEA